MQQSIMENKFAEIALKYENILQQYPIEVYNSSTVSDMRILRWWMDLTESGEIDNIRQTGAQDLYNFIQSFQFPVVLFYSLNVDNCIEFAMWLEPADNIQNTVNHGTWSSARIQGTKKQYWLARLGYSVIFDFFNDILVYTWQPNLLKILAKFGYNIIGMIPKFLGHDLVYHLHLSKENFYKSRFMSIRRK